MASLGAGVGREAADLAVVFAAAFFAGLLFLTVVLAGAFVALFLEVFLAAEPFVDAGFLAVPPEDAAPVFLRVTFRLAIAVPLSGRVRELESRQRAHCLNDRPVPSRSGPKPRGPRHA